MLNPHPNLDEQDWNLILQLLQQEQRQLPVEMHHTQDGDYREMLKDRRQLVDGLIQRLQSQGLSA